MELTTEQKDILEQFREAVKDELPEKYDDYFLLQWLRARKFNLEKAGKMFRKSMEWRRQFGIDNIQEWDMPEVIRKYVPGGLAGYDKEGSPVWIELAPQLDWSGLVRSVKKRDILKQHANRYEMLKRKLAEQTKKLGTPVNQIVVIYDLEKLGGEHMSKYCINTFTDIMAQMEANYPEMVKYCFVLNAPKIFPVVYNLAEPFLSERTKNKVKVLGNGSRQTLLNYIDADQLPVYYGGTKSGPDGDICCTDQIHQGGTIPEEYYAKGKDIFQGRKTTPATVPRLGTLQIELDVFVEGSKIIWAFVTKDGDISYGIYLKTSEAPQELTNMNQVLNTLKVNSDLVPEDGSFICRKPGRYVFVFDNNYCLLNGKDVEYIINVEEPVTQTAV